jgi:hypothetical protein
MANEAKQKKITAPIDSIAEIIAPKSNAQN